MFSHKLYKNYSFIFLFIYSLLFINTGKAISQNNQTDLTRYTPSWIKDGFADAGATHETWKFQIRRNINFNPLQKEYYDYQTSEEYIKYLAGLGITVYHIYCYKGYGFQTLVHMAYILERLF